MKRVLSVISVRKAFLCCIFLVSVIGIVSAASLSDQPIKVENPYSDSCPGILTITSSPPGATVYIDSAVRGTTPLERIRILSGRHTVRLTMNGYIDTTDDLTVLCDTTGTKQYTLRPILITTTTPVPAPKVPARALVTANILTQTEATKAVPAQKSDREQQVVPAQAVPAQVVAAVPPSGPAVVQPHKGDVCTQLGQTDCSGTCVDLNSDPLNCGSCGNQCSPGEPCTNGGCGVICPEGLEECREGACMDLKTDSQNCGSCGNSCYGKTCCDGQCIDLKTNLQNCGSCGNSCRDGTTCCDGQCVSLLLNSFNCGSCGNDCSKGAYGSHCINGVCHVFNCRDFALAECSGTCVDTHSDPYNCGSCGNVCPTGTVCGWGTCGQCTTLQTNCYGTCEDLSSSCTSCGACGNVCPTGAYCDGGKFRFYQPACGSLTQSGRIETCSDGIKNQGETGIDCGGICPPCNFKCITGTKYAPSDTPCTSVYHYDSTLSYVPSSPYPADPLIVYSPGLDVDTKKPAEIPFCQVYEVCHPDLDRYIEEANRCCSMTSVSDMTGFSWEQMSACKYAIENNNGNCKKCIGLYIIKELSEGSHWMMNHKEYNESWNYKRIINDGRSPPQPTANYLINYYDTGVCRDYATVLTTLLRKAGYAQDEVGSYCDGAHCYNAVKFPGDMKWHNVDADAVQAEQRTSCFFNLGSVNSWCHPYCHQMDQNKILYGWYFGILTPPISRITLNNNGLWTTSSTGDIYYGNINYNGNKYQYPVYAFVGQNTINEIMACNDVTSPQCDLNKDLLNNSVTKPWWDNGYTLKWQMPASGPGVAGSFKDLSHLPSYGINKEDIVGC